MDKVQKLSSNECYTPSSEPFRIYECNTLFRNVGEFMLEYISSLDGEIGYGVLDWTGLAQDRDKWRALVNAVMNFLVL
jgi:hypothetical protein